MAPWWIRCRNIGEYDIRLPAQRGSLQVGLPDDRGYERLYDALKQRVLESITKRIEVLAVNAARSWMRSKFRCLVCSMYWLGSMIG